MRRMRRMLIAGAVLVAVGGGACWPGRRSRAWAPAAAPGCRWWRCASAPFTRVVIAEGYLRPVKATPLTAPNRGRALLIAWLAEDGAQVKKGDVVIRFDSEEATRALADGQADREAALSRIHKEKLQVDHALERAGPRPPR